MSSRWARFGRGWVVAAFATFVAAFSHSVTGGQVPTAFALFVSLTFSGVSCVLLAGKTLAWWRFVASVAISQGMFHFLFSSFGDPTLSTQATMHHTAGMVMSSAVESAPHHDGWMWVAHSTAAVITIVTLRYGEAAYWGILGIASLFLATLLAAYRARPVVVAELPASPVADRVFVPRDLSLLLSALRHRGPPRVNALA